MDIAPELQTTLQLAWLSFEDLKVTESSSDLHQAIQKLEQVQSDRYRGLKPSEIPELQMARKLYRGMGMDPTRVRPSSEALLRRCQRGKGLYRINSLVDTGNLFSLERLLPIGLYDHAHIQGDIQARMVPDGGGYEGIRKGFVHLGGRVALHDLEGPFGNPSSDSLRTCIRPETRSALWVLFLPAGLAVSVIEAHLERSAELVLLHNGGRCTGRGQAA